MASKYTQNYQLCQWVAEDKVLREEFCEDNRKIDAAIHAAEEAAKTADTAVKAELMTALTAQKTELTNALAAQKKELQTADQNLSQTVANNKTAAESALNAKVKELQTTITAVETGASLVHLAGPVNNSTAKQAFTVKLSGVDMSQYRALLLFTTVTSNNSSIACDGLSIIPYNGTALIWIYNTLSGIAVHSTTSITTDSTNNVYAARKRETAIEWTAINRLDCNKDVAFIDVYGLKA